MPRPSTAPAPEIADVSTIGQELKSPAAWRWRDRELGLPDPLLALIAARFRLLGEPVRLKLLALLEGGERSVGELVALTGAGQPNISKHLAALADGGLVRRRKAGTTTYYAIADTTALGLCDIVCSGLQERLREQARALGWGEQQGMNQQAAAQDKA